MKIKIQDIEVKYRVFHRKVKYARLEIKNDELILILPIGVDDHHKLIKKHEKWVYQKITRINRLKKESENRKLDLTRSKQEFRELVKLLVDEISGTMGYPVNRVSFRQMKTRWGSCSSSGNVNFNTRLRYLPESLIRYVVHHEVCHLQIRKHNKQYWNLVSLTYPYYQKYENELAIYWFLVKDLN
ncbi:M48 family metallopeptidase [Methanobacterium sp.]|uniref:M48 family metallopeptidase n=1 Tax=Methanobacterium sp. TaxID=2164 RepID=UPI002ABCFEBA|nr:M48 family metallopeptidase [Methanobacterium sp.]MDY9922644.1 M48 family metallopeptidase [Methanobacterium sp.]